MTSAVPTSTLSTCNTTFMASPEPTRRSWVWYPTAPNTSVSPTQARIRNSPSLPTNSPALDRLLTTMDEGIQRPWTSPTTPETTTTLSQAEGGAVWA